MSEPRKEKSRPKKGQPIEVTPPKRSEFFGNLKKLAKDRVVKRTSTKR